MIHPGETTRNENQDSSTAQLPVIYFGHITCIIVYTILYYESVRGFLILIAIIMAEFITLSFRRSSCLSSTG